MNVHLRIGDNRTFSLKQAVLLYQEGRVNFLAQASGLE